MTTDPTQFPVGLDGLIPLGTLVSADELGACYIDRNGDVWEVTARTGDGRLLVVCREPQDPADAGQGDSFPWTLDQIAKAFGPLARHLSEVAA